LNIKKAATINHRQYDENIKSLAKNNRKNASEAEKKFWYALRDKFQDFKFKRQFAIDNKYIVDFICLEKRLIIELDGGQHNENIKDLERTKYLEEQGFKVVRFWNNEVLKQIDVCFEVVRQQLTATPHRPLRGHLSRKGRG
jgi:very-short-patch-repair endonuclease